jgi:hypothetical protein
MRGHHVRVWQLREYVLRSNFSRSKTISKRAYSVGGEIVDLCCCNGDVDPRARASRAFLTIGSSPLAGQWRSRVLYATDPMRIERKRFRSWTVSARP